MPPATVPNQGDTLTLLGVEAAVLRDVYTEGVTLDITAYNSRAVVGSPSNQPTDTATVSVSGGSRIRIDDVSDESVRLTSGAGLFLSPSQTGGQTFSVKGRPCEPCFLPYVVSLCSDGCRPMSLLAAPQGFPLVGCL